MIGGAMLLMTVSAMMLILLWADKYDDLADSAPRGGFFSMTAGRAGPYDKRRKGGRAPPRRARRREAGPEAEALPARRRAEEPERRSREGPVRARSLNGLMHESEADAIAEEIAEAAWARETGANAAGVRGQKAALEEAREAFRAQKAARAAEEAAAPKPAPPPKTDGRDAKAMAEARRRFGGLG